MQLKRDGWKTERKIWSVTTLSSEEGQCVPPSLRLKANGMERKRTHVICTGREGIHLNY